MFKVLDEVCEPKRATKYSACVDLFAREDVVIGAGETKIVPLGVKIDLKTIEDIVCSNAVLERLNEKYRKKELSRFMQSHYLALFIRSSLAAKGLIIPNGQGVIDLDYPDEIGLIVHNPIGNEHESHALFDEWGVCTIKKGDKVAQCTILPHKGYLMGYESDVVRNGGFGSSGK